MSVELKIGENIVIGAGKRTFIIAEIGQNHQGDLNTAKNLIKTAKNCGADCVKFQKTNLNEKFNLGALEQPYTSPNSWGATYGEHKMHLEFTNEEFIELQSYAKEIGIFFTASAMDCISLNFLVDIGVPFVKIGSGDANNYLLLEEAAQKNIPLIISTGMQQYETVKEIYKIISRYHKNFALLHCVSAYPTPFSDVNLKVLNLYKKDFSDIIIGYSAHELGTHVTVAAVAMGAKIIERHITLDKNQKGSDHKCSLNPSEFTELVDNIRTLESSLGHPIKTVQPSEASCYEKLGKSIVYANDISAGQKLSVSDLKIKVSVPKGIDGADINKVLNEKLAVNVKKDAPATKNDFI